MLISAHKFFNVHGKKIFFVKEFLLHVQLVIWPAIEDDIFYNTAKTKTFFLQFLIFCEVLPSHGLVISHQKKSRKLKKNIESTIRFSNQNFVFGDAKKAKQLKFCC